MLSNIVGCIFIFLGTFCFLYPESMRKRLRKKAIRKLRSYFFLAAIAAGVLLISAGWKHEGILPKILMVVGVVAIVKGLSFLKSKATEGITAWILKRSIPELRVFAVGQIVLGFLIIYGLTG